jgi:hypothetical protein
VITTISNISSNEGAEELKGFKGPATFEQWKAEFERRGKTLFQNEEREVILYHERYGFLGYQIFASDHELFITKAVGDGRYWWKCVNAIFAALEECGIEVIRYATARKPYAFIKKFGGRIVDTRYDGATLIYTLEWNREMGRGKFGKLKDKC